MESSRLSEVDRPREQPVALNRDRNRASLLDRPHVSVSLADHGSVDLWLVQQPIAIDAHQRNDFVLRLGCAIAECFRPANDDRVVGRADETRQTLVAILVALLT